MIKSVNNYPISQLFDIDAGVVYAIPRYQREYTWRKGHWESLFDDILENDKGYFLGSIICINQSTDALSIQRLELVDGQQRLTTLSLIFAAGYRALKNHEKELDEENKFELVNLKRKLVLKKGDDQIRVIPQIQNNNHADYRAVLAEIGVISPCDVPPYAGNRRIFRAFRYFEERIEQMINAQGIVQASIMDFLHKVNQALLVKIEVASHAHAYTLFESLNNRGMPLTAVDLIKNKLLARLETIEPGKIDYYFGYWNKLLGFLGENYEIQERFFRQYYNAFKDELKAIHLVPIATRSNLIQIYEKLINYDAKTCLEKICEAGRYYALLLNRNQVGETRNLEKPLKDLERIQGAPAYLLLLYLLVHKDLLQLTEDHLIKIVRLLVRFFVRRNLTDTPPTRDLNRLFMAITEKIASVSGEAVLNTILFHLALVSADDQVFRSKLEGPIYEENTGVTRFILCALAERGMTKETWVDLWKVENKRFLWTIEHIFPQGENIPQCWIAMLAEGDEQKAKDYQQEYVHKLGNLTISGFNSALGNKSFEEKRDRKDRQGRYVGYRNGLKLNEDLVDLRKWSVEEIENRTRKLVDQAISLFQMNAE